MGGIKLFRCAAKMPRRFISLLLIFFLFFGIATCTNNPNTNTNPSGFQDGKFRVWWQQGFYPEEAEAIRRIVADWEKVNGVKVELTLFSDKDIVKETENAIATGKTPDVLYNPSIDLTLIPRLAWENKLADATEVIEPFKNQYSPSALQSVNYQNGQAKKRSYYAIPIQQQTANIHYWRDLLKEVNVDDKQIPQDWQGFWKFWENAQTAAKQKGLKSVYGLGLPMSPIANDTIFIFEQFLEAYDTRLLDQDGKLLVDSPNVRKGIITALTEYTNFFKGGYVPPNATEWSNADNNVVFLSRNALMTINPSLSIPGSQKQETDTYTNKMVTITWPAKPNGKEITYLSGFKQAVIFEASSNKKLANNFLAYLLKPENLGAYLKDSQGRYFPVMPSLLQDPFWNDPKDPHVFSASKQYKDTLPFPQVFNPAYTEVQAQKVWGNAILNVVKNGLTPEQATDQAITEIKKIFAEWK